MSYKILNRIARGAIFTVICFAAVLPGKTNAQNWGQVSEIDSIEVFSITEHNGELFAVTSNEVYTGTQGGSIWKKTNSKPAVNSSFFTIFSYNDNLFIGTWNEGVFRSTNSGETWSEFNTGLPQAAKGIVEFAGMGDSLFVGTDNAGVYYCVAGENVWRAYNTGLFQFGTNSIFSMDDFLLANVGLSIFRRAENENEWRTLFFDQDEAQRQVFDFFSLGNYIFAGTDNGVYRGSADGLSWERKDIGVFPGRDIISLAAYGNRLFAGLVLGGEHWIFSSVDFGENWEILAHEFSLLYDLIVHDDRLWAARLDGLWYLDLSPTGIGEPVSELPNRFILEQNYPNPFNPTTTIKFTVPISETGHAPSLQVNLVVYDVLGREAATLVNQRLQPGNHEVEFDASTLTSGVYIYRLKAGDFVQSRKMILQK